MTDVEWFVGIDWGPDTHDVCIVDRAGTIVERQRVAHTASAIEEAITSWLRRAGGEAAKLAVAIEIPRGALVDALLHRGLAVYAINPKQLDRFRDRFTVAGAKDDRRDAEVAAQSLRTDAHRFRRVHVDQPQVIALREWTHLDEDLRVEINQLTNRLRDLVHRIAPEVLTLSPAADEAWFWTLWREAPTPAHQARLSERRLARLLTAHRIRRLTATELRAVLQRPVVYTAPGTVEAVTAHIQLLLPRLELIVRQRRECERQMVRLLDALEAETAAPGNQREHRDVAIVRSMPGIGTRIAAAVLAEASQPLAARAYHTLRAQCGIAPVTHQSGGRRTVTMRYACNRRLKNAAFYWARSAMLADPASRAYFHTLRSRGKTYAGALRAVANRLLRILFGLLRKGERFDPTRAQQLIPSA